MQAKVGDRAAGKRLPQRGSVRVEIGAPIYFDGTGWRAATTLRDSALDAVAAHAKEPALRT